MPEYIPGDNYVICDVCGFKIRVSASKLRWDGARVCAKDWEPRHPLDFIRGIPDHPNAPVTNPEQPDTFSVQTIQDEHGIPVIDEETGEPLQGL